MSASMTIHRVTKAIISKDSNGSVRWTNINLYNSQGKALMEVIIFGEGGYVEIEDKRKKK